MSRTFRFFSSVKYGHHGSFIFSVLLPRPILRYTKLENWNATLLLPVNVLWQYRNLNTYSARCQSFQLPPKTQPDLKNKFEMIFPKIIENVIDNFPADKSIEETIVWFQQVMYYNVFERRKNRGMALLNIFNYLCKGNTNDSLHQKACVLGWCIEMLQTFLLINSDIIDQSESRKGKLCSIKEGLDLNIVNDSIILEAAIYKALQANFRETVLDEIVKEFREATWKALIGQCMDSKSSSWGKPNWNLFTPERYATLVKYKTTWYTFCLPVNLVFILISAGEHKTKLPNLENYDSSYRAIEEELLIKIGHYFQVQDDYIDCFGNPQITGKHGTHIENGKCSWLILEALRIAEPVTKKMLQEIYGKKNEDDVSTVKEIYKSLNIPELYAEFEKEMYAEICNMINNICSDDLHRSLYLNIIQDVRHTNN